MCVLFNSDPIILSALQAYPPVSDVAFSLNVGKQDYFLKRQRHVLPEIRSSKFVASLVNPFAADWADDLIY